MAAAEKKVKADAEKAKMNEDTKIKAEREEAKVAGKKEKVCTMQIKSIAATIERMLRH